MFSIGLPVRCASAIRRPSPRSSSFSSTERPEAQAVDEVVADAAREEDRVDARIGESCARRRTAGIWRRSRSPIRILPLNSRRPAGEDARQDACGRHPPEISATSAGSAISKDASFEDHAAMRSGDPRSPRPTSGPIRGWSASAVSRLKQRRRAAPRKNAARPDRISPARRGAADPSRSAPSGAAAIRDRRR